MSWVCYSYRCSFLPKKDVLWLWMNLADAHILSWNVKDEWYWAKCSSDAGCFGYLCWRCC